MGSRWTDEEMRTVRKLDLELAKLYSEYMGGPWHNDGVFVPTRDNLERIKGSIDRYKNQVDGLQDSFWRNHLRTVLESLEFTVECNTKMPYEYITRLSSSFDALIDTDSSDKTCQDVYGKLVLLPAFFEAIADLLKDSSDLARSQIADMLPPVFANIEKAVKFIESCSVSEGQKTDAKRYGAMAIDAAKRLLNMVKSLPLDLLQPIDIPFEFSLEKGMQVNLDYVLSWYEEDVIYRRDQFFKTAKEINPGKDAYYLLNFGSPGYASVEELFDDMRKMLKDLRESCLNFIDLPPGADACGVGLIPETWRMVCPTFMQMGNAVCVNPDNLSAFRRGNVEETLAHEAYPGHYAAYVKSAQFDLPNTFKLDLFMSRSHQEGIAHRSEFLMMPFYQDPIARLEAARRGWYCATRVKAEVDLYYNRRPVREVVENYVKNLNCTEYSAVGQTRAHMMRPGDGVSYYAGMRYIEDLFKRSDLDIKDFTNETFSYGCVSLETMKDILELSAEKKEQLKSFGSLKS